MRAWAPAAGVLAAALYVAGLAFAAPSLCFVAKPLPVLALAAWVLTGPSGHGRYARFIVLGLGLSAVGDVLLEEPSGFVPGMGAFLLAHLTYVAAFVGDSARLAFGRLLPFAAYASPVFALLVPGLGGQVLPVAVYATALTVMQWRAAVCVGATPRGRTAEWSALAGAVLFALSDGLLGLDRFRAPIAHARYVIIALYWLGQTGLALSTQPRRRPEPARDPRVA